MTANPQKENGYVPIANELVEALGKFRIPGECQQVLWVIFRKTYGFNKKEDAIANTQFVEATGMKKGNVSRSLSKLIINNIVIKSDNKSKDGNILKINKDYHSWIPFVIKSDNKPKKKKKLSKVKPKLSKVITNVISNDNKTLSEVMDTKDIKTIKDTIQKTGEINSPTPFQTTTDFFKGVADLIEYQKANSPQDKERHQTKEMTAVRDFLRDLAQRYPDANKTLVWAEIQKFYTYWTERNKTGKKKRWEMEKTFEVDRRLSTWFSKIKAFENKADTSKSSNYSPNKIY